MFKHLQHQPDADLIDAAREGFRSGIRRGAITKGHSLTNQVTHMLDGIIDKDSPQQLEWKIGELIGLVQWVEANYTASGDSLPDGCGVPAAAPDCGLPEACRGLARA